MVTSVGESIYSADDAQHVDQLVAAQSELMKVNVESWEALTGFSYLVQTSLVPLTGRDATPDVSAAFKYRKFSSTSKFKEMEMEIAAQTAGSSQEV